MKAWRDKDFWSLEVAIPWADLGATPRPGKIVGFNVCRDRNIGEKEWTNWSRTKSGFHDPFRFADLVLSGTPDLIGKLAGQLRQGDRTGPMVVYSAEGFSKQTYAQLAASAFADLDKLMTTLEAERKREPSPAAANELGKRLEGYRAQVAEMRTRAQGNLDAADWTRLDLQMQKLIVRLKGVIWEARLKALLDGI